MRHEDVVRAALAGKVQRWHTWPMIRQQSVGEHSCRVAQLYVQLYGMPRAEVLYYCLCHDMGEMHAGDVPFNAKRDSPELKSAMNAAEGVGLRTVRIELPGLTDEEWKRVKICDYLELYEHCRIEIMMGNKFASVPCDTITKAMRIAVGDQETYRLLEAIDEGLPE